MKISFLCMAAAVWLGCSWSVDAGAFNSVLVPRFSQIEPRLDGIPDEPFWRHAAAFKDFMVFRKKTPSDSETLAKFCMDRNNFYLSLVCREPDRLVTAEKQASPWAGDNVEIFFADLTPRDWFRQIVIGSNGAVYTELIEPENFYYAVKTGDKQWSVEVVVPLKYLKAGADGKMRMNIFRQRTGQKQLLTMSDVGWGMDIDRFAMVHAYTPPDEVVNGPWTFGITDCSAGINWETAGGCAGRVYFRPKGAGLFREIPANIVACVQTRDQRLHPVFIDGLTPDTEYEYHVGDQVTRSFRTLNPKPEDFSFIMTSDIHGHSGALAGILKNPAVQNSDMMFILGDLVSGMVGRATFYEGFLDTMVKHYSKPFYCTRGNHEGRGPATGAFFEIFPGARQASRGAFVHKGVFFIMLETELGDAVDKKIFQQQAKWLKQVMGSTAFKHAEFRVLLAHSPLIYAGKLGSEVMRALVKDMSDAEKNSFDVMLAGHVHRHWYAAPGSSTLSVRTADGVDRGKNDGLKMDAQVPFPVVTNDGGGFIVVKKDSSKLSLEVLGNQGRVSLRKLQFMRKK